MHILLRNTIAILFGVIIGGLLNGMIINISPYLIPPPEGVDLSTIEGLTEGIKLMQPKHFIMPFLAHALGTFAGALLTSLIAKDNKRTYAVVIGVFFMAGGIMASITIPAPAWFIVIDLSLAYIPMAYLASRLTIKVAKS